MSLTHGGGPPLDPRRVADFLARAVDLGAAPVARTIDDTLADLAALGLPPGASVVTALSNSLTAVRIHFAALLLGLVPVLVSPAAPTERIRRLAAVVDARALIAARPDPRRHGAGASRPVDGAEALLLGPGPDADRGAGAAAAPLPFRAGEVLMSTSGTSGGSSVCLHRVDALLRNARRHAGAVGLGAEDIVLVNLPLYYSYAMVAQVMAAYETGARMVLTGPPFTATGYAKAVADQGVTHSSITPELVRRLLADGAPFPAPGPRVLTIGGDRIDAAQVGRLLAARPGGELYLTYGLTEAGPRVATLAAHAEPEHRHSSVGLPLPGVRVALRDEDPGDGTGELLVESDTVLTRKLGSPGPDRSLIGPGRIATGDLFRIDADGYLFFRGRVSDFAVVRGEKISLAGLRQAVHAIEGVVSCVPKLSAQPDGQQVLDLEVAVADLGRDTGQRIRRALNSVLLPAERPRHIFVSVADADPEFRK
ncbi:acyl--CoA ligase [Streptacidiphilus sp. PB12-B1b]|uniref:class I adenylate-forming enzyme family protein n=1 Tax=Streptacidiphilus sp. PB12-B1b TaxID=2705012 RepID=UPI0015FAA79A|nr:class I adenylate-forming enzyme family protein [Streptacidiphilus sp. PB12-B1b]QMU78298.1 acyl--CoA ligase [Streptacidiphilus sp. PB12-B1b]